MADKCKLTETDDSNPIDFSPRSGYNIPEDRGRSVILTLDRTPYLYDFSDKELFEIPINNISSANTTQIATWWRNRTSLYFYPDYPADSLTKYIVKIMNEQAPLQMMYPNWKSKYEGVLVLHEV